MQFNVFDFNKINIFTSDYTVEVAFLKRELTRRHRMSGETRYNKLKIKKVQEFANSRNKKYYMIEEAKMEIRGFNNKEKALSFMHEINQYFGDDVYTKLIDN